MQAEHIKAVISFSTHPNFFSIFLPSNFLRLPHVLHFLSGLPLMSAEDSGECQIFWMDDLLYFVSSHIKDLFTRVHWGLMPHRFEQAENKRMGTTERKWIDWVAGGIGTKPKRKDTASLVKAGEPVSDLAALSHQNRVSQHWSNWKHSSPDMISARVVSRSKSVFKYFTPSFPLGVSMHVNILKILKSTVLW